MAARLRIALVLPGETSLGAFEAGAVSALLLAVTRINAADPAAVAVDVVSGSSSGALTAVVAARALLTGRDPVAPLRRAWVSEPSLQALRGRARTAPLTLDRARAVAQELLARPFPELERARAQGTAVRLDFALTSLRGFTYMIERRQGGPLRATSHVDWATRVMAADGVEALTPEWAGAVDDAVASASHPVAFAATVLDRSAQRAAYADNGVRDLPEGSRWLYADGGLVERQPLRRCLALAREIDGDDDARRVVLVVRPDPDAGLAADDPQWTDADRPPWASALARALRIAVTHSLYEDLRHLEKVNDRLAWTATLSSALVDVLRPQGEPARAALAGVLATIARDEARWRGAPPPRAAPPQDLEDLVTAVLEAVTGLRSRRTVRVDVIAPAPGRRLLGSSYAGFGGFLAERLRASDFTSGYAAMLGWLEHGLAGSGAEAAHAADGLAAARARAGAIPGWPGGSGLGRRARAAGRVDVARVGWRAARIMALERMDRRGR